MRRHLRADGVGPHDDVFIVDSGIGLLVDHLTTQRSMSLHLHTLTSPSCWPRVPQFAWHYLHMSGLIQI